MVGMAICIIMTFFTDTFEGNDFMKFFIAFPLGGLIGLFLACRVEMINMP